MTGSPDPDRSLPHTLVPDSPVPDSPVPDSKDWTWVLTRPCPECGFDTREMVVTDVGSMLRANTERWEAVLAGAGVTVRPAPAVWSPLEYGAHVRDVHRIYLERLHLMLTEDGPSYPNWDQDESAITAGYHRLDPAVVARELRAAADALADRFDRVALHEWARTGHRSDGATFTIDTFARYFIHDPIHHLHDVGGAPDQPRVP